MEFTIELIDLVGYVAGTLFGLWVGYKHGAKIGANHSIVMLCDSGYVHFEEDDYESKLLRLKKAR